MGIRVSEIRKFDLLLHGSKTALLITYELVRNVAGGPCISTAAATQGFALLSASIERNQLKFAENGANLRLKIRNKAANLEEKHFVEHQLKV